MFLAVFLCAAAVPAAARAATYIPAGSPSGTFMWTKEGSPYVIEGPVSLRFASLTIEAGTVVKFLPGALLEVHAAVPVDIRGTIHEPVYFTSFKDDSVGGDTNGDGTATVPAPGDWGYASFGSGSWNASFSVSYLKARYGGDTGVSMYNDTDVHPVVLLFYNWYTGSPGQAYSIETIEASRGSDVGLYIHVGKNNSVALSGSSFYENSSSGVRKTTALSSRGSDETGLLNLVGNWWGSETGPYHPSLNPAGTGDAPFGTKISIDPWLTEDPLIVPIEYEECCSSVAFLPGLEGSVLKDDTDTLWPPTLFEVEDDLEKLSFSPDGTPTNPDVVVDGIINTFDIKAAAGPVLKSIPIYQDFSSFMDSLASPDPNTGTFTINAWRPLPYDWRYSPEHIVANGVMTSSGTLDLMGEVEQLAANSQTGKVTLVAHSYGGLVGKALIKALQDKGEGDVIDNFIMVASPQLGTPQAIGGLLHGEGSELDGRILGVTFTLASKEQMRDTGENMESAYDLLPSPEYFNRVQDPVLNFSAAAPFGAEWISVYGNEGIKNYADMVSFMLADLVPHPAPSDLFPHYPALVNASLLSAASTFHGAYDSFTYPPTMRVVQVAGWGLDTIKGIKYVKRHGGLAYDPLWTSEGDATVVYSSAVASNDEEKYFFNLFDFIRETSEDASHQNLLGILPIRQLIDQIVTGSTVDETGYISSVKPSVNDLDDKLLVSSHSPITIGATDMNGNYTGIVSGQDPNADMLFSTNGIPKSHYFTFGDGSYVSLPHGGQYTLNFKGTGEGTATIQVETLAGNEQSTLATYSDFPVTNATQASLTVSENLPGPISIDQNGDGQVDTYVATDDGALSLGQLLTNLTTAIHGLAVEDKLKNQLLKKIDKIKTKIERQKDKQSDILAKLHAQVQKKADTGTLDADAAIALAALLDDLVGESASVPLDQALLEELESQVDALDAPQSLKNSLRKKIERLKNLSGIERSLATMTKAVMKKSDTGKLDDADAQYLLGLLDQIQNAL